MSDGNHTLTDSVLISLRGFFGQVDRTGWNLLEGPYKLWSGGTSDGLAGEGQARSSPHGYTIADTPGNAAASQIVDDYRAKHGLAKDARVPQDVFEGAWERVNKDTIRRAVLSGHPVESFGLDSHPTPAATLQVKHELPTLQKLGGMYGVLGTAGGLFTVKTSLASHDPIVQVGGSAAGVLQTLGGVAYGGGALLAKSGSSPYWSRAMSVGASMTEGAGVLGALIEAYETGRAIGEGRAEDATVSATSGTGLAITAVSRSPVGPALVAGTLSYRLTMAGLNAVFGEHKSLTTDDARLLKKRMLGEEEALSHGLRYALDAIGRANSR